MRRGPGAASEPTGGARGAAAQPHCPPVPHPQEPRPGAARGGRLLAVPRSGEIGLSGGASPRGAAVGAAGVVGALRRSRFGPARPCFPPAPWAEPPAPLRRAAAAPGAAAPRALGALSMGARRLLGLLLAACAGFLRPGPGCLARKWGRSPRSCRSALRDRARRPVPASPSSPRILRSLGHPLFFPGHPSASLDTLRCLCSHRSQGHRRTRASGLSPDRAPHGAAPPQPPRRRRPSHRPQSLGNGDAPRIRDAPESRGERGRPEGPAGLRQHLGQRRHPPGWPRRGAAPGPTRYRGWGQPLGNGNRPGLGGTGQLPVAP